MSGKCDIPVPGYTKPVTFGLMESFDYPVVNSGQCLQNIMLIHLYNILRFSWL